ncbi:hypothetical protein B0T16DRAFT_388460 [Cercophora newfieldiana]|uniref:MYND-type domain-containing protein n=1 Tax=Cercophora newfieldiana TaxID=92897 RepID=A0AA39Y9G0_9PEZI|nr:hypothetical protein B0T16DRAFT_388460 [Cercophora newfieldiana]
MSDSTGGIIAPAAGEILRECQVCDAAPPVPLSLCGGCRVVHYCCRNHQVEDRPTHKSVCKDISTARADVDAVKQKLLDQDPSIFTAGPQNKLYGRLSTDPKEDGKHYIRVLTSYAEAILKAGTQQAVKEALAIYHDLLRLDREVGLHGAGNAIPALLIRLDRDQEAYDVCVWFQKKRLADNKDWLTNMETPILDIHGANIFEDLEFDNWLKNWSDDKAVRSNIPRSACVLLILARLWFGFKMIVDVKDKNPAFTTAEVFKKTREVFPIDIVERHPEWLEDDAAKAKLIQGTLLGATSLAGALGVYNDKYFKLLENPHLRGSRQPTAPNPKSEDEAFWAFDQTYKAWEETPKALDLIMGWTKHVGVRTEL